MLLQKQVKEMLESQRLRKEDFINSIRRDKDKMDTIKVHSSAHLEWWQHLADKNVHETP